MVLSVIGTTAALSSRKGIKLSLSFFSIVTNSLFFVYSIVANEGTVTKG